MSYLNNDWPVRIPDSRIWKFYHRMEVLTNVSDCLTLSSRMINTKCLRTKVSHQRTNKPSRSHMCESCSPILRLLAEYKLKYCWPGAQMLAICSSGQSISGMWAAHFACTSWVLGTTHPRRLRRTCEQPVFLMVVYALSKWSEMFPMPLATTTIKITALNCLSSRFGIPGTIISDDGVQYRFPFFKQNSMPLLYDHKS